MSLDNTKLLITPNGYKSGKLYSAIPESGAGDLDFARATTATRINSQGLIESVGLNVPRVDYPVLGGGCPSLLIEPQRTNLLINSETLATQTVTVTATARTLSFYGTGTIVLSGARVGTLVGSGENNRVSLTFTPTAGSLTLTVTGQVLSAQLEQGTQATSYIPTIASAVTRNTDVLRKDITPLVDTTYSALLEVSAIDSRLKIEHGSTGFDLPLNGTGRIVMVVDNNITFYFPNNGQATTVLTYEKPSDLRNLEILSKVNGTKIKVIAVENGVALQSRIDSWLSGNVSSFWIHTNWGLRTNFANNFKQQDWDYIPVIDTSSAIFFQGAFENNNLTSFPKLNTSNVNNFGNTWFNNNLTSFPKLNVDKVVNFINAFRGNQLTTWLPNYFDTCIGTNFTNAWIVNAIDQTGVDNILISINTARIAGVQTGTTKIIGLNGGTNATPSAIGQVATDALRDDGWTVNLNGY